ncbi:hypothetical protein [Vibrio vulnificus]|nr:hypothetical protein [Vibrio vulnificus]
MKKTFIDLGICLSSVQGSDEYGKPVAFYCDKHSIYRVNQEKQIQLAMF